MRCAGHFGGLVLVYFNEALHLDVGGVLYFRDTGLLVFL